MLINLTKERLQIRFDEKTLRDMVDQGDINAKFMLATLLIGQSPKDDMESSKLLHEVCSDESSSKEALRYSYSLLGDQATRRESYLLAENHYKEALYHGSHDAVKEIRSLYDSGHLTKEPHHDDYNYLYRKDIDLAIRTKHVNPALEQITKDLRKSISETTPEKAADGRKKSKTISTVQRASKSRKSSIG